MWIKIIYSILGVLILVISEVITANIFNTQTTSQVVSNILFIIIPPFVSGLIIGYLSKSWKTTLFIIIFDLPILIIELHFLGILSLGSYASGSKENIRINGMWQYFLLTTAIWYITIPIAGYGGEKLHQKLHKKIST